MFSIFTLGGIGLVVAGGIALWYFNRNESEGKVEDPAQSLVEETSNDDVKCFL
jgi:hypothetical protein